MMNPPDPTEEIRQIKRQLAAQFDNDLLRMVAETRRRQHESGSTVVTRPPRVIEVAHTPNQRWQPSRGSGRSRWQAVAAAAP